MNIDFVMNLEYAFLDSISYFLTKLTRELVQQKWYKFVKRVSRKKR